MQQKIQEFKNCFNGSPVAFCALQIIEKDGKCSDLRFVYLNDSLAKIANSDIDTLQEKSIYQIFPNPSVDFLSICSDVALNGGHKTLTIYSRRLNKYLHLHCYSLDRKGYCAMIVTDVTQQQLLEFEREKNVHTLDTVVSDLGAFYWEYDVVNNSMISNSKALAAKGLPVRLDNFPEVIIEKGWINQESIADFLQLHSDMKEGLPHSEKSIHLSSAIHDAWYLVKYTNVYDDNGKPSMALATLQNMDAYKELEQQFNVSTEQAGMFCRVIDLRRHQIIQSDYITRVYRSLPPFETNEQLIDMITHDDSIHPDDREPIRKIYQRLFDGENVLSWRCRKMNYYQPLGLVARHLHSNTRRRRQNG